MQTLGDYSSEELMLSLARVPHMTPRLFDALLQRFGSLERLLIADSGSLMAIPGISPDVANRVSELSGKLSETRKHIHELAALDVGVVTRFDERYPPLLSELHDPPLALYYRGALPDPSLRSVSLVSGAHPTAEAISFTSDAARRFAEGGVQILSPIIDNGTAHLSAKGAGGRSFLVLASGLLALTQPEEIALALDARESGGVLTEYPNMVPPDLTRYPETNRLLAAIPQAVVVTSARHDSREINDLMLCCSQIGKLVFLLIDTDKSGLVDEAGLHAATTYGAIPIVGLDRIDQIIQSLV